MAILTHNWREQPMGESQIEVTLDGPNFKDKSMIFNCSLEDFYRGKHRIYGQHGIRPHIQEVFPYLTTDEREFLLTGMTPEEWNRLFGEDPKDD